MEHPTGHRAHPRYEVHAHVDVAGEAAEQHLAVRNLSLGGICIHLRHADALQDVGTLVDLAITFEGLPGRVDVRGAVVWVNRAPPSEMGIRFLSLDETHTSMLRDHLRRAIAVP